MSFLLLHLTAPMQSWGSRSRFEYRDTEREPTFSGVVGILAAAMGKDRTEDLSEFSTLNMIIRVDREGIVQQEFQTAQNVLTASNSKGNQIIRRDYLSDAEFHVALEGEFDLLTKIFEALESPVYPLFLGRKSYIPAYPILYPENQSLFISEDSAFDTLCSRIPVKDEKASPTFYLCRKSDDTKQRTIRFVIPDTLKMGETRNDIPSSFDIYARSYRTRHIKNVYRKVSVCKMEE